MCSAESGIGVARFLAMMWLMMVRLISCSETRLLYYLVLDPNIFQCMNKKTRNSKDIKENTDNNKNYINDKNENNNNIDNKDNKDNSKQG